MKNTNNGIIALNCYFSNKYNIVIVKPGLFPSEDLTIASEIYDSQTYPNGIESIMCSIHNSFHSDDEKSHNCIGCNLAEYTNLLRSSLSKNEETTDALAVFSSNIFFCYLLVERFEEIFKIVQLQDKYKQKYFQVFAKIRRWCNFLKHPKAFMFVHHPEYYFEGGVELEDTDRSGKTMINQEFIDRYYSGSSENTKLYQILTNKKDVIVIFPNLSDIIKDFCSAQTKFIELISQNEMIKELLNGQSTLNDFYSNEDLTEG